MNCIIDDNMVHINNKGATKMLIPSPWDHFSDTYFCKDPSQYITVMLGFGFL